MLASRVVYKLREQCDLCEYFFSHIDSDQKKIRYENLLREVDESGKGDRPMVPVAHG